MGVNVIQCFLLCGCGRVGGVFLFLCNWCFVCFFLFNGASFGRFVLRMVCGVVMYGFCLMVRAFSGFSGDVCCDCFVVLFVYVGDIMVFWCYVLLLLPFLVVLAFLFVVVVRFVVRVSVILCSSPFPMLFHL